jgi:hypothetical protein
MLRLARAGIGDESEQRGTCYRRTPDKIAVYAKLAAPAPAPYGVRLPRHRQHHLRGRA